MNGSILTVFGILLLVISLILNGLWIILYQSKTYKSTTMLRLANMSALISIIFLILGFARSMDHIEQIKPIIGTSMKKQRAVNP